MPCGAGLLRPVVVLLRRGFLLPEKKCGWCGTPRAAGLEPLRQRVYGWGQA